MWMARYLNSPLVHCVFCEHAPQRLRVPLVFLNNLLNVRYAPLFDFPRCRRSLWRTESGIVLACYAGHSVVRKTRRNPGRAGMAFFISETMLLDLVAIGIERVAHQFAHVGFAESLSAVVAPGAKWRL